MPLIKNAKLGVILKSTAPPTKKACKFRAVGDYFYKCNGVDADIGRGFEKKKKKNKIKSHLIA